MTRRPAFDPSRLDNDLDQLLPPPPAAPEPTPLPQPPPATDTDKSAGDQGSSGAAATRPSRGSGGRPRPGQLDAGETPAVSAVTAVRIPKPLYDAVVGDLLAGLVERPSYAQIVAWTCEDHPEDVLAELERAATLSDRAPRGRKLATEVVALALRFRPAERRTLDDLMARSSAAGRPTRTAAVVAALRVAVKHGLPSIENVQRQ